MLISMEDKFRRPGRPPLFSAKGEKPEEMARYCVEEEKQGHPLTKMQLADHVPGCDEAAWKCYDKVGWGKGLDKFHHTASGSAIQPKHEF